MGFLFVFVKLEVYISTGNYRQTILNLNRKGDWIVFPKHNIARTMEKIRLPFSLKIGLYQPLGSPLKITSMNTPPKLKQLSHP